MLCILDVFYFAIFFIIASLCSSLFLFLLRLSLVGSVHTRSLFCKKAKPKTFVFCYFMSCISLCINNSARKMPDCKRFAFLSYFPSLSFYYRFALFFVISLSASLFSRGLRPHPHAFCKKRGKNFYVLFLCVLIYLIL